MTNDYIDFGEKIDLLTQDALKGLDAHRMFNACVENKHFDLVELRQLTRGGRSVAEILVVDCFNDGVPTNNETGILYRERLGLVFFCDAESKRMPEVRALRSDFPATLHQNFVDECEPASLCLYFESWDVVQRSWTPQSYLNRILWWLSETAQGTLHKEDQPVEQFYLRHPYEIVLPPEFEKGAVPTDAILTIPFKVGRTYIGKLEKKSETQISQAELVCIVLQTPSVAHRSIEPFPHNIGTLHEQLEKRGVDFIEQLRVEIRRILGGDGILKAARSKTLVILQIPIKRSSDTDIERVERKAFFIGENIGKIGESCGALSDGKDGKYYAIHEIVPSSTMPEDWRSIKIGPIEVLSSLSRKRAQQASGIAINSADFPGILAGVGALGSAIAEVWYREAWGSWTFVDPDYIKPHNLARHLAKHGQLGQAKAEAVKAMVECTYAQGHVDASAIVDKATNWSNVELKTAVEDAELVIDATTTLSVPRDLSKASLKRAASIFLTPSGTSSVLLLEDSERNIRLDSLEAQYYTAILGTVWGKAHLNGAEENMRVGASCRDISNIISVELVQAHASILARQVRLKSSDNKAVMSVWEFDSQSGGVNAHLLSVSDTITVILDDWKIVWNSALKSKARDIRSRSLPNETGGIILGYIDNVLKKIFIVDILPAPVDSIGTSDGFIRGSEALAEQVEKTEARTAHIVSYIGEWHSHPDGNTTTPSKSDFTLLAYLAENMNYDGFPAIMLIIGDNSESWCISKPYEN